VAEETQADDRTPVNVRVFRQCIRNADEHPEKEGVLAMKGKMKVAKGRIEEAAGAIVNNEKLRAKGQADQAMGRAQQAAKETVSDAKAAAKKGLDKAKDSAENSVNKAKDSAQNALDKAKDSAQSAVDKAKRL
jgi:uncharacterized protein YjbJ (UPF0337 family)